MPTNSRSSWSPTAWTWTTRSTGRSTTAAWSRSRPRPARHLAKLLAEHEEPDHHDGHRQVRGGGASAQLQNDDDNIFVLVDESHRGAVRGDARPDAEGSAERLLHRLHRHAGDEEGEEHRQQFGGLIRHLHDHPGGGGQGRRAAAVRGPARGAAEWTGKRSTTGSSSSPTSLTKEQKADLKKKFATHGPAQQGRAEGSWRLPGTSARTSARTGRARRSRRSSWRQDKATALMYKQFLDEFGMVTSRGADLRPRRAGGQRGGRRRRTPDGGAVRFWKKMMAKHGSEKEYNGISSTRSRHGDEAGNHHRRGQAADRLRRAAQHGALP